MAIMTRKEMLIKVAEKVSEADRKRRDEESLAYEPLERAFASICSKVDDLYEISEIIRLCKRFMEKEDYERRFSERGSGKVFFSSPSKFSVELCGFSWSAFGSINLEGKRLLLEFRSFDAKVFRSEIDLCPATPSNLSLRRSLPPYNAVEQFGRISMILDLLATGIDPYIEEVEKYVESL